MGKTEGTLIRAKEFSNIARNFFRRRKKKKKENENRE
jgi:hypothetical protein